MRRKNGTNYSWSIPHPIAFLGIYTIISWYIPVYFELKHISPQYPNSAKQSLDNRHVTGDDFHAILQVMSQYPAHYSFDFPGNITCGIILVYTGKNLTY